MVKKKPDKYILVGDGEIVKQYDNFNSAVWDIEFYQLMYKEVKLYQLVIQNATVIK